MHRVTLYTRHGCHLCEQARAVLEQARQRAAFALDVVDVDGDVRLRAEYGFDVPVVLIDGMKAFEHRVTLDPLLARLQDHPNP